MARRRWGRCVNCSDTARCVLCASCWRVALVTALIGWGVNHLLGG